MRLVIDTNIIISALIKNSVSRKLILDKRLEFCSPDFILVEIKKYKTEIVQRSCLNKKEIEILLSIILNKIEVKYKEEYEKYLTKAEQLIKDIKDVSFLAVALSENCSIWSDDKHFDKQNKIKIYKTKDLVKFLH